MHPLHHPIKAGLDLAGLTIAIGVVSDYLPYILAAPSFIWAMISIAEWIVSKWKNR